MALDDGRDATLRLRGPFGSVAKSGNTSYTRVMTSTTPNAANLLRDLRRQQGRSLRGVAADIGLAPSHLSRLERGQRGIAPDVSERLSAYYGVNADIISLAQGEVPSDILQILLSHPELMDELRTQYKDDGSSE